eukprot:c23772_g1_i1 orf=432-2012(+)
MALGNPQKRKSVFSNSRKGKSVSPPSQRVKSASPETKKGKFLSTESKKKKQKMEALSASPKKKSSCSQEGKVCSVFAKLIDSGTVSDQEAVFYLRKKDKSVMKEGRITREGVLCCCCNHVFFLSKFEAHAGSGLHRPSANMFLRDGRSLMDCQYAAEGGEACNEAMTSRRSCFDRRSFPQSEDKNDNLCQICGDGGELMLCDSCPSAFHYGCLHLDAIPEGDWHCSRCRCGSCGLGKSLDSDQDGASMISCAQCHVPYHQSCLSGHLDGSEGPWFCMKTCHDVFKKLRRLVGRVSSLGRGLSWMLLRSYEEMCDVVKNDAGASSEEKLSEALKLLQQCFDPIVDHETGVDVLSQIVFSRTSDTKRLDCSGFYTMLLMKGEQLVSVATIRTHGRSLAEMPFVGTADEFRHQGMCKALMQALETMLRGAGVYKLIIPSINEVVETWTGSFGFKSMSPQDRQQFSGTNILSFPGTTLLSKSLLGPVLRKRTEPALGGHPEVRGRSVIQVKEKLSLSDNALSGFKPISCH